MGGRSSNKIEETQYEKDFAKVAREKWQLSQEEYRPFVDKFIGRVQELDTDGARDFVRGSTASATGAAFDRAGEVVSQDLMMSGANPNSGKYKVGLSDFRNDQGAATAENVTRSENQVRDQHIQGLQAVSAMGRGESAQAQHGLLDAAQAGQSKAAQDAFDAHNNRAARNYAIGAGLGTVASHVPQQPSATRQPVAAAPHRINDYRGLA